MGADANANSQESDQKTHIHAGSSPVKSPTASPLPPVREVLNIAKRRRLEPESPAGNVSDRITPHKNRSFSTPSRVIEPKSHRQRTPSLQDRPIPILSPPLPDEKAPDSPALATAPSSASHSQESSTPAPSTGSSTGTTAVGSRVGPRDFTSPLELKSKVGINSTSSLDSQKADLVKRNAQLDRELRNWKRLVDIAQRAHKYEADDEPKKLRVLIEHWRTAAQGAANYLLNEARGKVEAMGGMEEYKNRLEKDAEYQQQFDDDSFDLSEMSEEQREEYEQLKEEFAKSQKPKGGDIDDSSFTMAHLLKLFNIDSNLLFPDVEGES